MAILHAALRRLRRASTSIISESTIMNPGHKPSRRFHLGRSTSSSGGKKRSRFVIAWVTTILMIIGVVFVWVILWRGTGGRFYEGRGGGGGIEGMLGGGRWVGGGGGGGGGEREGFVIVGDGWDGKGRKKDVVEVAMIFDDFRKLFVRSVMRSLSWYNSKEEEGVGVVYHLVAPRGLHGWVVKEVAGLGGRWKVVLYDLDGVCGPWVGNVWFMAKGMHRSAMCKMFLAKVLPRSVKRVLFLDSDSTVVGKVEPCWFKWVSGDGEGVVFGEEQFIGMGVDMGATCQIMPDKCYPVGFEWEIPNGLICGTVPYRAKVYAEQGRLCRNPGEKEPYQFNSGVILMDLDKMRERDFVEKFIRTSVTTWRANERKQAQWGDQCLINNFLRFYPESLYELPCGCNYQYSAERREVKCPNRTVTIAHGWNKQMANELSKDSYNIHFRFFRDHIPTEENKPPVPRLRSMKSPDWNVTLNEKIHTSTCPHQSFTCTPQDLDAAESAPLFLDDRVHVLTRTARRPRFFIENAQSVAEQTHGSIDHLVLTDDPESVSYLKEISNREDNESSFSYQVIQSLYDQFDPEEVCRKCKPKNGSECARAPSPSNVIARKMFFKCYCSTNYPMNTYFNSLHRQVKDGWVIYLDDDNLLQDKFAISELLASVHSVDEMLVYRATLGRVTPLDENFGKRIVAGDFDASNFMFHSKHIEHATWGNQRCGDYRAGSNLARHLPVRWIDTSFVQANPLRAELGGLGARGEMTRPGFTAVITSYQAEGWRPHWLKKTITTYLSKEYAVIIDRVILVWNNVEKPPPDILPLDNDRLHVIRPEKNSLNNRWTLTEKFLRTSAVLNLDDDLYITLPAIICMFNWHKKYPKTLLGPFVRRIDSTGAYVLNELHDSSAFSMVLPRAMVVPAQYLKEYSRPEHASFRLYVDQQEAHCDDVLLNLLSQEQSPTPPLRIAIPPSSLVDFYMTCYPQDKQLTGGLGLQSFRSERRTECVRHLMNATRRSFRESHTIGTCLPRGNAIDKVDALPKEQWEQVASKHVQCGPE